MTSRSAGAVRDYLTGFGIPADRLGITGMGACMPLDGRSNEQVRALNRRAEFAVTAGGATLVMSGS
jgi:outer membrane protein OmpA-like peptidoglycan-associated protein